MFQIRRLKLSGWKSIRHVDLPLRPFNVLIGGNGAGKSNLLSFFALLNALANDRLDSFVARAGGAGELLFRGSAPAKGIDYSLDVAWNSYTIHTNQDLLRSVHDLLRRPTVSMWSTAPVEELEKLAQELHAEAEEPIQSTNFPSAMMTRLAHRWRVYHFHDTSPHAPVKQTVDVHDNRFLRADAGNLAAFLFMLRKAHPNAYRRICAAVRLAAPFFGDFVLEPVAENPNTIILKWRDGQTDQDFGGWQLSDGTLRFICLATLLLQPKELIPAVILIDEPELGLHPQALSLLGGMLRSVPSQVIVATQSVPLLDLLITKEEDIADVITVDRRGGESVFSRPDPPALTEWLHDYSPSELWEKGVLGGQPGA